MARMFVDCRQYPSEMNFTVAISADTKEELVDAAGQHAVAVHGHHDSPQLRQELDKMIKTQEGDCILASAYGERPMTAFNVVRFRVRPGRDQEFLDAHKKLDWPGLTHVNMIKTGDRSYCLIAEWPDPETIVKARPNMIATLNSF